jgi:hypothetical protein
MNEHDRKLTVEVGKLLISPLDDFGRTSFGQMTRKRGVTVKRALSEAISMWVAVQREHAFFEQRRETAQPARLRALLDAGGGEEPQPRDRLPSGYVRR